MAHTRSLPSPLAGDLATSPFVVDSRKSMGSAKRPDLSVDIHWTGNEIRPAAPKSLGTDSSEPSSEVLDRTLTLESKSEVISDDLFPLPEMADLHRCVIVLTEWVRGLEKSSIQWLQGLESEIATLQKELTLLSTELDSVRKFSQRATEGTSAQILDQEEDPAFDPVDSLGNELNGAKTKRADKSTNGRQLPSPTDTGLIEVTRDVPVDK